MNTRKNPPEGNSEPRDREESPESLELQKIENKIGRLIEQALENGDSITVLPLTTLAPQAPYPFWEETTQSVADSIVNYERKIIYTDGEKVEIPSPENDLTEDTPSGKYIYRWDKKIEIHNDPQIIVATTSTIEMEEDGPDQKIKTQDPSYKESLFIYAKYPELVEKIIKAKTLLPLLDELLEPQEAILPLEEETFQRMSDGLPREFTEILKDTLKHPGNKVQIHSLPNLPVTIDVGVVEKQTNHSDSSFGEKVLYSDGTITRGTKHYAHGFIKPGSKSYTQYAAIRHATLIICQQSFEMSDPEGMNGGATFKIFTKEPELMARFFATLKQKMS